MPILPRLGYENISHFMTKVAEFIVSVLLEEVCPIIVSAMPA